MAKYNHLADSLVTSMFLTSAQCSMEINFYSAFWTKEEENSFNPSSIHSFRGSNITYCVSIYCTSASYCSLK